MLIFQIGIPHREPLDVGFVQNGMIPWNGVAIGLTLPIKIGIDNYRFWDEWGAVPLIVCGVISGLHYISKYFRTPFEFSRVRASVWINQQFIWVEAVAVGGLIRPM